MNANDPYQVNAAYVESWKQINPKLMQLETDGHFLKLNDQQIDISGIYMQDVLSNPNLFDIMGTIEPLDLFNIIDVHIDAVKIKKREIEEKIRSMNQNEYEF